MSYNGISLGKAGEKSAAHFLRKKGYTIIQTNYRTRYAEIDIIADHRNTLVFIEVKTRKTNFLETPLAAVTVNKQRHISMAAQLYLGSKNLFDKDARFDVIAVYLGGGTTPRIEHIENAFELNFGF
ncbi:YraN family protein [Desulfopila inferna]|uniref:YraN family protein n=1 Tax=Desulfopila inferna TaxID=468528 RepID=UPI001964748F|nr:YraN family protein [Desulfopila inferna]MBM9604313.1 YraN family protein [Desulfopila inferna]